MSDTPTDSTACAKAQAVRAICEHLAQMFTQDPVQTIWEGHLQYEVAMFLLNNGWSITLGEPGGKNDKVATIVRNANKWDIRRGRGAVTDSIDLIAAKDGTTLNLQLKSYPSVGRKRGRAGVENGLRKDLDAVRNNSAVFMFVADEQSYRAFRGEREGARGPKHKWYLELPTIDQLPPLTSASLSNSERLLATIGSRPRLRVVCALWESEHADFWRDGPSSAT